MNVQSHHLLAFFFFKFKVLGNPSLFLRKDLIPPYYSIFFYGQLIQIKSKQMTSSPDLLKGLFDCILIKTQIIECS